MTTKNIKTALLKLFHWIEKKNFLIVVLNNLLPQIFYSIFQFIFNFKDEPKRNEGSKGKKERPRTKLFPCKIAKFVKNNNKLSVYVYNSNCLSMTP